VNSKSKLQILVALSDIEDLHMRLAASGAFATVTSSPNTCKVLHSLQMECHHILPILAQLIDLTSEDDGTPLDPATATGLLHRGIFPPHPPHPSLTLPTPPSQSNSSMPAISQSNPSPHLVQTFYLLFNAMKVHPNLRILDPLSYTVHAQPLQPLKYPVNSVLAGSDNG